MQELIDQLVSKAGLTQEQAQKAAQTATEFIRSKVPPMFHGMVDSFLSGESMTGDFVDKAKDMFGKAGHAASDLGHKAADMAGDAFEHMKGMFTPGDDDKTKTAGEGPAQEQAGPNK